METKTKDKNKIMENQLTFDLFNNQNEVKNDNIIKIFIKSDVMVKKSHLKRYRKVRKFKRSR